MTTGRRTLGPPPNPPTREELLEVFRRVVSSEYANVVESDPGFALIRAFAAIWERVADASANSVQARYHLPSAYQTHPPASSDRRASGSMTLSRNASLDRPILARPGELQVQGPGSRIYVNSESVYWAPGDGSAKAFNIQCEVAGFVGNLDFLADDDGFLDETLFSLVNQDRDRANVGGSIAASTDSVTRLRDSGSPSTFSPSDVGLYLQVTNSANPENVGEVRKVVGFVDSEGAEYPTGSGLFPNFLDVSSLVQRNAVDVQAEDSGTGFTGYWLEASEYEGSFPVFPVAPSVGDALYIGASHVFAGVSLEFTPGEGDWDLAWEYWNGAAWTALPGLDDLTDELTDNSGRAAQPENITVSWVIPLDSVARVSPAGGATLSHYVRVRISAFTSATTIPVISRLTVHESQPLALEESSLTWSILDYESLGVVLNDVKSLSGGRDNDLYLLGKDRGSYQQPGEPDDAFRKRITALPDTIAPNAVIRAVNRALSPYLLRGNAIDVGDDGGDVLSGMFYDVAPGLSATIGVVGAYDLYDTGDLFPEDPWILNLSAHDAYGYGLVLVPPLGFGDFGAFCDDGPVYYDEGVDTYYGPAYGGFCDGYAVTGDSIYLSIYQAVDAILGFGIEFDIIKDISLAT